MAKALGYATGQQDAWSKQIDRWAALATNAGAATGRLRRPVTTPCPPVLELATEIEHFPRHLGIHSGGMVICDRR